MQLVQLILPLFDNSGQAFPGAVLKEIRDDVILAEVMVETLDRQWRQDFRSRLEQRLSQKSIVIRAIAIERL